jgi:hypothetical protein
MRKAAPLGSVAVAAATAMAAVLVGRRRNSAEVPRLAMPPLPNCDDLFLRFFDPWYDDTTRMRRGFNATLPDVLQHSSFIGLSQTEASCVTEEGQQKALKRIEGMVAAARDDWPSYLPVTGDVELDWITAFDCHYDRNRIRQVIENSDPSDFSNDYVLLCCEFGAALGHVLRAAQPRLVWRLDWPYWDSSLLDPKTGSAMPVFHWAIKKMSEYGVDDGFAAKVRASLQFLDEEMRLK